MFLQVGDVIDVAKGISEFGFTAIASAFHLVITGTIMIFFVKWFMKIVKDIIQRQTKTLEDILSLQKDMIIILKSVSEGIDDETLSQVKIVIEYAYETTKHEIYYAIKRMKVENNLNGNKEGIQKKVHSLLVNTFNNRNQHFDAFTYKGRKLSSYTDADWVEKMTDLFMDSLYDENFNKGKIYTNLDIAYSNIVNQFYKNLIK